MALSLWVNLQEKFKLSMILALIGLLLSHLDAEHVLAAIIILIPQPVILKHQLELVIISMVQLACLVTTQLMKSTWMRANLSV